MDPSTHVDVITTVNGGVKLSQAVAASAALLGYESGNSRPPNDLAVSFVDYPFTKANQSFADHLEAVEREAPPIAVAPDVDSPADLDTAVEQADRLLEHAETVVMVPKGVLPEEIPDRFCVGLPLANWDHGDESAEGSAFDPDEWVDESGQPQFHQWTDYRDVGCVHVLGGSPTTQFEVSKSR